MVINVFLRWCYTLKISLSSELWFVGSIFKSITEGTQSDQFSKYKNNNSKFKETPPPSSVSNFSFVFRCGLFIKQSVQWKCLEKDFPIFVPSKYFFLLNIMQNKYR